jgi:hypothetical protein
MLHAMTDSMPSTTHKRRSGRGGYFKTARVPPGALRRHALLLR